MPDDPKGAWYFGVICEKCSTFLPIGRDPSQGRPGTKFAGTGTVIATCTSCRHPGRYPVTKVEQRRTDLRRAEGRAARGS